MLVIMIQMFIIGIQSQMLGMKHQMFQMKNQMIVVESLTFVIVLWSPMLVFQIEIQSVVYPYPDRDPDPPFEPLEAS